MLCLSGTNLSKRYNGRRSGRAHNGGTPVYSMSKNSILLLAAAMIISAASAHDTMPVALQNALVQKYCAVCHTDAARNGGLSLEHFDAGHMPPSLAAMLLSKLTGGVDLKTVRAAESDPAAAAVVAEKMKGGAMGAAGIPRPDQPTIRALIDALASEAAGADAWSMDRAEGGGASTGVVTASILRELSSARGANASAFYRLVLTCDAATRQGDIQLAWSPLPAEGVLSIAVDGGVPFTHRVQGTEKMGNGAQAITAHAAASLQQSKKEETGSGMLLPASTLRVSGLFPKESVEFPFAGLPEAARQALGVCFAETTTSR